MGGRRGERTHVSAVVAAGTMLLADDETQGLVLGQSADGRRGMEGCEQVAQLDVLIEGEGEVAAQMHQLGGTDGLGSCLEIIDAEALEAVGDVGGNIALLLDVLHAPVDLLALAVEVVAAELHRSCEGNGASEVHLARSK